MKKTSVYKTLMFVALMFVPFTMTSCDEWIDSNANIYTMGFLYASPHTQNYAKEIAVIDAVYKEELAILGITQTPFSMDGIASSCDSKIIAACIRAERRLKTKVFNGSYVWHVARISRPKEVIIYEYEIN